MTLCLWKMWYCKKMLSLPASLHPLLHFWCAERSTLLSTKKKIKYRPENIIVWFNVMSQTSSLDMKREAWSNFRNSEKMIFLQISCSQNVHNVASSNKKRNRKKLISTQSGCLKWYIDKIHSLSNASHLVKKRDISGQLESNLNGHWTPGNFLREGLIFLDLKNHQTSNSMKTTFDFNVDRKVHL